MADKNRPASPTIEDMFAGITIDTKDKKPDPPQRPPPMNRPGGPKGENMPPPGRRGPPPAGHRPSRSQEEAMRARRRANGDGPNSPPRRVGPGPGRGRRNSESSLSEKPVLTEEEKKAREKRRREREERKRREGRDRPPRVHRDMDLIDKLDATSIYGTGVFHHSGPYDAVIASRNKAASGRAPMAAFAKDSANMSIGGSGPLQSRADHSTFMGNATEEAFTDYATSISGAPPTKKDLALFDPHRRASVIHGDETVGLGTSTFLEGTPAARAAVQKAEQENALQNPDGGLQRKKSLAQRIRGMNRPPRGEFGPSGRLTNPDAVYRDHATSASMSSGRNETNPFFAEYEPGKDGEEQITVRKMSQAGPGSPASPPLPGTLERRSTTDALSGPEQQQQPKKSGGGLLTRMKSLKGGPRSRPADRDTAA
ncbi:hypothetical protein Daus18300_010829 [Diaporthe australafricana]|uniref:Pal1 cell morphology protein n=1 Tax=Diaporthe australafricana TaxID=127596 RepID=A0ABR3W8W6_9PEZI